MKKAIKLSNQRTPLVDLKSKIVFFFVTTKHPP